MRVNNKTRVGQNDFPFFFTFEVTNDIITEVKTLIGVHEAH